MRHSITKKIAIIIISLVAGTVLLCWFLNTAFLEKYYISTKKESLQKVLDIVQKDTESEILYSENARIELEKICAKDNIAMMIMNPGNRVLFLLGSEEHIYRQQLWEILFTANTANPEILQKSDTEILQEYDMYSIGKYRDSRLSTEYLFLLGYLEGGNLILMRTALENIRESVAIANRFLGYIGFIGIILSAVISYMVTRKITNPILQLADLSKRMTNLEFDAKFQSRGKDEIDFLGEHMNELSETLEQTISELKSANNELMIDIEKKKQIDDMRKEFLSNVSHELKTPLALIQGYAEGLQECVNDDAESREFYCEVIIDEANKMNRMVRQLLTLNQLEFGNEMITMERFNITELIQGVIHSTAILREQAGIRLIFEEKNPVYVWADEFKTEEVVTNFMSNAIHHADFEKEIIITIQKKGETVRIRIFNTGKQIPQEELAHIWTKFYKVDKARTREYGGSGIGLSIVKAIMDSFHQQCGVENHSNGVEFWFELDYRCNNR